MEANPMTPADAAALLEADKLNRRTAAATGLQAVLDEHRCDLLAVPQITPDGRIVAVFQIVAR